jgi:hypothetical protein
LGRSVADWGQASSRYCSAASGLIEARRLGLPDTEIVDLDRLTEQLKKAAAAPAH